ncbi:hypothetical protein MXB_2252 [Myxobolus squamalis]|nr:hypothetical protein MXB_2252 [Myxobolus squamalis]
MVAKNCELLILSALDEIAWLFNLRGSDIHCCPVFKSFSLITLTSATLFIDKDRISPEVDLHLNSTLISIDSRVSIQPYLAVVSALKECVENFNCVWISDTTPAFLALEIPEDKIMIETNPVCQQKAVKNIVELKNLKVACARDAACLCEFFGYLEKNIHFSSINEYQASTHLFSIRSDGTTDITRTLHFGTPTPKERECYTLVLKGHISLARAIFPKGTKGSQLDSFAREHLWNNGLNFLHGTGHGIGMFLNVHEGYAYNFTVGPQRISTSSTDSPFEIGNVLSNEPGYYEDGKFGIRIENMMTVVPISPKYNFNEIGFFGFETLSLIPMALNLIDISMLDCREFQIQWLNNYHQKCLENILPVLQTYNFTAGVEFLEKNTRYYPKRTQHRR